MVSIFFFSAGTALVEDIPSLASSSNSPTTTTVYGNTGCRVFMQGVQNWGKNA